MLERIVAVYELLCSGLRTRLSLQSLDDILQIRLNMPDVTMVDLRPVIREFVEHSRDKDIDIKKHREQKQYIGFFPEAQPAKTKVKTSVGADFEDDLTLMDEIDESAESEI